MAAIENKVSTPASEAPPWWLWLLFFAYAAIVALLVQLVLLPHVFPGLHAGNGLLIGGDWIGFHHQAVELAEQIHREGWSAWRLRPDGLSAPAGISGAIYAFTVPEPWTAIPLYAALHATAALVVLRIVQFFVSNWRQAIWCVLPFLLYPSAMLVYTQIHKDAFSMAGALLALYGWVLLARYEVWRAGFWPPLRAVLWIVLGSALAWLVRPYWVQMMQAISVILALVLMGVSVAGRIRHEWPWSRVLATTFTVWVVVGIMTPLTRSGFTATTVPSAPSAMASTPEPLTGEDVESASTTNPPAGEDVTAASAGNPLSGEDVAAASTSDPSADQTVAPSPAGPLSSRRPEGAAVRSPPPDQAASGPSGQERAVAVENIRDRQPVPFNQPMHVIQTSLAWRPTPSLPRFVDNSLFTVASVREQARLGYSDAASAIDTGVMLDSAAAMIAYLPRAVMIVFLAPFPADWLGQGSLESTTLMRRVAAGEMLGIYLALAALPYAVWHWRRRVELWVVLVFCTGMMVVYSLAIPTVGVLYRVRYGFLMTLVAVAIAGCFCAWAAVSARMKEKPPAPQQHALTDGTRHYTAPRH